MNPDTATKLAEQLLEYPESEWDRLIEEWCGRNDELKRELIELAGQNRNARDFVEELQKKVYSLAKTSFKTGINEPEKIEGYKIIKRLGSGGSAIVYLAEDEAGNKTALKLLRAGAIDTHFRHRFESEQFILSRLNHPNIARLIEGGITENGTPFVVMEYVDGTPIDVWCRKKRLSVRDKLKLFRTVCHAVHYAHQNLLVHRDIKPDHILITKTGNIKLIDFGIAKLLEPDEEGFRAVHTRTGSRVMTPEFASPEQVRGEQVTTASDIYSLGVLLFLLLTGRNPYRFKNTSMLEIERLVCEEEPAKPSDFVSSELGEAECAKRQKKLKGDLDRIILMAMRKEPGLRYASAQAFSDDLQNYLEGEPVIARSPTMRYRIKKFVWRHKIPVAAAAFALLALTAGLVGTIWQANQARMHAELAEVQAQRAEQVSIFLTELFEESDPNKANDGSRTAREMLDQGFEKVQTELAEQPAVQAQMLGIIGKVYQNLGFYDQALPALEKAVEGYRQIGESSPQYITVLLELANLQYRLRKLDDAEALTREALEFNIGYHGDDHPEVASVLNTLAIVLQDKDEEEEAIQILRRVVDIRRKHSEAGSNLAANLNNLAILLQRTGRHEESGELFAEALEVIKNVWGETHPYMAFTLNGYSGLHQQRGDYALAEASLRRALEIGQTVFPETHPFLGVVLHNLGKLFEEMKNHSDAAEYFQAGLELRRKSLPPGHADIASSLDGLATVLIELDQPAEAEPMLREALEIRQNTYPENDWRIAQVEAHLGRSLLLQKRFDEAEMLLSKSYTALKISRGDEDLHTRRALQDLVNTQKVTGIKD